MSNPGTYLTADSRRGFFGKHIIDAMAKKLPRRFKRLIYISSIMGLLQQVKDPDMHIVGKLNEVFKIANYPDAFIFPMYIKSLIWKDVSRMAVQLDEERQLDIGAVIACDLSTRECAAIGEHFARRAPSWLKYSSLDLMAEDVVKLVRQLKRFHSMPVSAAS